MSVATQSGPLGPQRSPPRRGTKLVSQESVWFNIDSFQALSHPDLVLTANPQQAGQALLVLG